MVGKIPQAFLSEDAKFKPVSQTDLVRAITSARDTGLTGQWAVRGDQEVSVKQLLQMIERQCGKNEGSTGYRR